MYSKTSQFQLCTACQKLIKKICRLQVCKALCSLFCSLTCDDASVLAFPESPSWRYLHTDSNIFLLSVSPHTPPSLSLPLLSGPGVAVGRCWTKDKSALFSLTGNSRAEQHLSPLIHYPTLNLASSGHHTSSFWDLSLRQITYPHLQVAQSHNNTQQTILVWRMLTAV